MAAPQRQPPRARLGQVRPPGLGFSAYHNRHANATGLLSVGTVMVDIQDRGRTPLTTTRSYAPPALAKHGAVLERLRRQNGTAARLPASA